MLSWWKHHGTKRAVSDEFADNKKDDFDPDWTRFPSEMTRLCAAIEKPPEGIAASLHVQRIQRNSLGLQGNVKDETTQQFKKLYSSMHP